MGLVFKPDGDASWGERLWPSCKYLTALWCCPCQMSALNNSDYTSHSFHSWRNRSMWHLDTETALVSFFQAFPLMSLFFCRAKNCLLDVSHECHQRHSSRVGEIWWWWCAGIQTSVREHEKSSEWGPCLHFCSDGFVPLCGGVLLWEKAECGFSSWEHCTAYSVGQISQISICEGRCGS